MIPSFLDEGEGEPLLLLMGLGAAGETWRPHLDVWRRSFRCIAIDNRGTGSTSTGSGGLTTRDLAEDAAELIRHLELGPVRVAGISMGACIAQELALAHPSLVTRAVLVAPWARTDPATLGILDVLDRARRSGDARLFNTLLRSLIWTPSWINGHQLEMEDIARAEFTMSAEAFSDQISACAMHDTVSRLRDIAVPTLVTWGRRDGFIRPDLSASVATAIPDAQQSVYETGHVHHWEELDRFNSEIEAWLR